MAIEIGCTGCGQTLRVADEHAGKKARCPACGTIVQVPEAGMAAPLEPADPAVERPFSGKPQVAPDANPFGDRPEPAPNPYAPPGTSPFQPPQSYLRPHRGGLILTFGLLGVLCCMPFAIVAWVMGAADLKEIRAGRMDPSGQGMTQAGMIIGMIWTILAGIWIVINIALVAANAM